MHIYDQELNAMEKKGKFEIFEPTILPPENILVAKKR